MKIFNGTQHQITFYKVQDTTPVEGGRKLILNEKGAEPYYVIAPGTNLNCIKCNADAPNLESPVPLVGAVQFKDADILPEGYDLYIVSNLYRAACVELGRNTDKLATVSGTVYKGVPGEYKPCGVIELAVG